jgi:hypothetical protein
MQLEIRDSGVDYEIKVEWDFRKLSITGGPITVEIIIKLFLFLARSSIFILPRFRQAKYTQMIWPPDTT